MKPESLKEITQLKPYETGSETNTHTEILYDGLVIFHAPKPVAVSFVNSLNGAYRQGILFGVENILKF